MGGVDKIEQLPYKNEAAKMAVANFLLFDGCVYRERMASNEEATGDDRSDVELMEGPSDSTDENETHVEEYQGQLPDRAMGGKVMAKTTTLPPGKKHGHDE
ncbi:hypothetical protein JTB14_012773 [Gonioctena quinquepunctata]|nr:hypothetical protein JTB14_012773 [Gonioctena quinquepunctata]